MQNSVKWPSTEFRIHFESGHARLHSYFCPIFHTTIPPIQSNQNPLKYVPVLCLQCKVINYAKIIIEEHILFNCINLLIKYSKISVSGFALSKYMITL